MRTLVQGVVRTVPLSPFALIRSTIAKKMQVNEEKNIKIVVGSKKSRTFATAIEKQRLQRKRVPWMSGLVSGLQNRVRRFESARNLKKQERIRKRFLVLFLFPGIGLAQFENLGDLVKMLILGQVKKYVDIIFEKHLKFAMLKTYILPKYYKSSTSDEHLIGRQHCNSEFMLITHRVFRLTPYLCLMKQTRKKPLTPIEILSMFLPAGILDYFDLVNHVSQDTCFILFLEGPMNKEEDC